MDRSFVEKYVSAKVKFLIFFLSLLFYSNPMPAAETNFEMLINGSRSFDTFSDLVVKDRTFTLTFRGEVYDTSMPGIGVLTGSLLDLDEKTIENLRSLASQRRPIQFFEVADSLRQIYKISKKLAKLDITTELKPYQNQLLLDVAFTNSGELPVSFTSPRNWEGTYNPLSKDSWIFMSASRIDNPKAENPETRFSMQLIGGRHLLNKDEFSEDVAKLNPGQTLHAKFVIWPSNGFLKGRYRVSTMVLIKRVYPPEQFLRDVQFSGLDSYADFSKDFPDSAEQKQQFESRTENRSGF